MPDVDGGRVLVTLEGRDVGLSQIVNDVTAKMNAGVSVAKQYDQAMNALTAEQAAAQSGIARYGQALAQQQIAAGNTAGAVQVLTNTLQSLDPATSAAVSTQTRLIQVLNQASQEERRAAEEARNLANEQANTGNAAGGINSLTGAVRGLSLAYAGMRAIGKIGELIDTGVELQRTETATRVLAGSQEKYNSILSQAKEQQSKYGGSLQDTLTSMNSFIPISNQTGVSLTQLENISRRLATVDPVQGFKGASVALKEFLTGDITSLSRRFEIPRDALNEIKNSSGDAQSKLEALDGVLTKFGASQELLDAQGKGVAGTYDRLKGAAADLAGTIGGVLASALQTEAENWAQLFNIINDSINQIQNFGTKLASVQQQVLAGANNLEQYRAKAQQVNQTLSDNSYASRLPQLTEAQFAFAKELEKTGISATDLMARLNAISQAGQDFTGALQRMQSQTGLTDSQVLQLSDALSILASRNEAGAGAALSFLNQIQSQNITVDQALVGIQQYITSNDAYVASQQAATAATQQQTSAIDESAVKSIEDGYAKQQESDAHALLKAQVDQAAASIATLGPAGAVAAAGLADTSGQIPPLIQRLLEAKAAADKARDALIAFNNAANIKSAQSRAEINAKAGHTGIGETSDFRSGQDAFAASLRKKEDAELNLARAQKNRAGELDILRRRQQGLNKESAEYINLQAQIETVENQQEADAKKGKKGKKKGAGGGAKNSPEASLAQKQFQDQEKFEDKSEDSAEKHADALEKIEKDHGERLVSIEKAYQEKELAQQRANEVSKRRSRASFYEGLEDLPKGVDGQKFAAQYEEAFAKAQQYAQQGKAKLADEFLKLRTEQINEMKELDAKEAEINNNDELNKAEKARQIAYLEGIRKLKEDAQREELAQLEASGDAINNEHDSQLAEEQKKYEDAIADENTKYETANEKIAKSSERTQRKRIEDFDFAHRHIMAGYADEADAADGKKVSRPTATSNTAAATTSKPNAPAQPVAAPTTKADDILIVKDDAVVAGIADMADRTVNKLGEVIDAVNNSGASVVARLKAVEDAVRSLRGSSNTLVQR